MGLSRPVIKKKKRAEAPQKARQKLTPRIMPDRASHG